MAVFDDTGLNAIRAGDTAGADAFHSNHPSGYYNTIGATSERAESANRATSGSSVTIGVGSKVFALAESRGWLLGYPVYIYDDTVDPVNNYMVGTLSADESGGVITVNVTRTSGAGTFTSWVILLTVATSTVVSPPVAIADGGTSATNAVTVRQNFDVAASYDVRAFATAPDGFDPAGRYLVADAGAAGAWAGHEGEYAITAGFNDWAFTSPERGDIVNIQEDKLVPLIGGSFAGTFRGFGADGLWARIDTATKTGINDETTGRNLTADIVDAENFFVVYDAAAVGVETFTLPNTAAYEGVIVVVKVDSRHGFNVDINVASAGLIENSATLTLTPGDSARMIFSVVGLDLRWQIIG